MVAILAGILLQIPGTATAQTSGDLAIAAYNTSLDVYVGDYMSYTMFVTNLGLGTLSSVVVTNILPSGFTLIDASPTYTLNGNTLTFNLGSLTNLAVRKLTVRAKPSSAGSYTFSASVGATNNSDPSPANNISSFNISVANYLASDLAVGLVSNQWPNFVDGLMEQWIQLTNNGSAPIASARVIVSGLTNELYNAAGTNNGNPFVILGSTLNLGQTTTMLLEFYPNNYFTFNQTQMQAFATPLANLSPPANLGTPITPMLAVRLIGALTNSDLTEFPTVMNQRYTIQYSDTPDFSHPLFAPPSIVANGNYVEWIDYGPPVTINQPSNSVRYYRVYQTP